MNLLDASSRVGFAAIVHDMGKFAQRTESRDKSRFGADLLDGNITVYCPFNKTGGFHTRIHAAYTALAFDELEKRWPDVIKGDMAPFASRSAGENITDSLINAAAAHHKPETFLQWVVATADRLASGFERDTFEEYNQASGEKSETGKTFYQSRMIPLLEEISLGEAPSPKAKTKPGDFNFCYALKALSPAGIFPVAKETGEPGTDAAAQAEYAALWQQFVDGLDRIPKSHRTSWPLWLDHFDSLWLTFTHAIPSVPAFKGFKPDVSLYDHSKAVAALAVALWRHAHAAGGEDAGAVAAMRERSDFDEKKLLLIQGDFFGIQDFIFAEGGQTNRNAAKILRGRSFQVSLFTELAALRILEALELPSTSQILNAAGKFLIVAPNTADVVEKLKSLQKEFDGWFLTHSFGLAGIGLAWEAACCNDFTGKTAGGESRFNGLMQRIFRSLDLAKHQRYDLCRGDTPVLEAEFPNGVCQWNGKLPADRGESSCALSRDQKLIGDRLVKFSRVLIVREEDADQLRNTDDVLELPVFGYRVMFAGDEDIQGKFGPLAETGALRRCWDFSLPESMDEPLWKGYARRWINGYVPRFSDSDVAAAAELKKYGARSDDDDALEEGRFKTFNDIAWEDRESVSADKWRGQVALMVLKGDVDNLGKIFEKGLGLSDADTVNRPTFAKMAALSRQMNAYFAVYLPALCREAFPNTYTVFAGGDDFFLIGPWHSTQNLAWQMAGDFRRYAAENRELHFSAGLVMKKPGAPVYALADDAEEAIKSAKRLEGKNAFSLFGAVEHWDIKEHIDQADAGIEEIKEQYGLSTGFIYSMLNLLEMSLKDGRRHPEAHMWRSKLYYRAARLPGLPKDRQNRRNAITHIVMILGDTGISGLKQAFRIPLFNHFYRQR
ncbi:MAG: type III-A CRISPR-associated protein Cas10/Csm1 [Methylobacteriaceae bacterium]|nr:type III-A CRISPR-associated protein Cas10/Csm1 [Methylobacteriaceae bacterium]